MLEQAVKNSTPETGGGKCFCSEERIIVQADLFGNDPDLRHVNVTFWTSGGHFSSTPSWRTRLSFAWKWLRGRPESADGVLLDRQETLRLMDALEAAHDRTWPAE